MLIHFVAWIPRSFELHPISLKNQSLMPKKKPKSPINAPACAPQVGDTINGYKIVEIRTDETIYSKEGEYYTDKCCFLVRVDYPNVKVLQKE